MKIKDIKVYVFNNGQFNNANIVKIITDEGYEGIGEAYWGPGVAETIITMKDLLIGQDPMNINKIFEMMIRDMSGVGSIAGTTVTAMSGVEIALLDLKGKILKTPVCNLLGGKFRNKVSVYCDCGMGKDQRPESYAEKAKEVIREKGFNIIKFDIDDPSEYTELDTEEDYHHKKWIEPFNRSINNVELEHMEAVIAAVRKAIGPEKELAIDMHWKFSVNSSIKLAKRLEKYNLLWLEDPVPPENIDAQREVTNATSTPILSGENVYRVQGYRDMVTKQAVRIIAPDIPKMGGLTEVVKLAYFADLYYIPLAPHNVASPIGTMASAHACAAIPNFLAMEYHGNDFKDWNKMVAGPSIIQGGYIKLSDKPGLGIELDEDYLKSVAIKIL